MKLPHDRELGGFPGTTCVVVLVQTTQALGHAGDSRLYLLREGEVKTRNAITRSSALFEHA